MDQTAEERAINQRRLRVVRVDERAVLSIFQAAQKNFDFLSVPIFPALPTGYEVRAVAYEFGWGAFAFLVWHPEFSPVPECEQIPAIVSPMKMMQSVYSRPKDVE